MRHALGPGLATLALLLVECTSPLETSAPPATPAWGEASCDLGADGGRASPAGDAAGRGDHRAATDRHHDRAPRCDERLRPQQVPGCDAVRVAAVGDVSPASLGAQQATAALVADGHYDAVLLLGDTQYEVGALQDFHTYFEPTWGRFMERLYPVPGNHEYYTPGASGYFEYFGARAGPRGLGYYSFDLGSWHLVALNTSDGDCSAVPCGADSEQVRWLREDLAATHQPCVLAFWHHPRFSSASHGGAIEVQALWETLYAAGADLVLNGHEHVYERFAPQSPAGAADPTRGLRQFVVGTGGKTLYAFGPPQPNSEARAATFGVLSLTLGPGRYGWDFVPVDAGDFSDTGQGTCHPRGPPAGGGHARPDQSGRTRPRVPQAP